MTDSIDHPLHYNSSKATCTCGRRIECIDLTRHMSFNLGNAIKYLWRYELKNGLEDLKKASWYLNDLIENIEKKKEENIGKVAQEVHELNEHFKIQREIHFNLMKS